MAWVKKIVLSRSQVKCHTHIQTLIFSCPCYKKKTIPAVSRMYVQKESLIERTYHSGFR